MAAAGAGGEYELSHDKLVKPIKSFTGFKKEPRKNGRTGPDGKTLYVYTPGQKLTYYKVGELEKGAKYFFTVETDDGTKVEHSGTFNGSQAKPQNGRGHGDEGDYEVNIDLDYGPKQKYVVSMHDEVFYDAKTKKLIDNRKEREVTHPAGSFAYQRAAAENPLKGGYPEREGGARRKHRTNKRRTNKRRTNRRKTYRKH